MKVRTRLLLTAVTLALCLTSVPAFLASAAQQMGNTANPASAAVTYSELEAAGMFSELYDHMHSDAKAIIPESAVVGWYENEFAPLGPGVITHTRVKMVSWTWEVTGTTYRTAEVSYTQPFADGTMVNDVVRLVREQEEWRWFFGRTQEFVEEQIARYGTGSSPSSTTTSNTSQQTSPNDMVNLLLEEPFLESELPPGYEITSVNVTEAGRRDGPMFGILRDDLGATWLNVDVTSAPVDGGIDSPYVLMQFAVFPTEEDAQRAFYGDQINGLIERNALGSSYYFGGFYSTTSHVRTIVWSESHVSPPQDNPPGLEEAT